MKRFRLPFRVSSVSLRRRARDEWSYRALGLAVGPCPVKPVLLARIAQDFLRELVCAAAFERATRIFSLSRRQIFEYAKRKQLILAHSPLQQLFFAGRCIEHPAAILLD